MFLKVSKTPHTVRCRKGQERKSLRIGTQYSFALVESCRTGKKIGQKVISSLSSCIIDEYEPLYRGGDVTVYGTQCIVTYVKSFDLNDSDSFRKVRPNPPVRFYHTFTRKLLEAASIHNISEDKLREISGQITKLIPLYSIDDYREYMQSAVIDRIRQEASGGYGKDLGKLIGERTYFNAYDLVQMKDGQLQRFRNVMSVDIKYSFELC